MERYKHDTIITFREYINQPLIDIVKINPSYLELWILYLHNFCIYPEDIDYIKSVIPNIEISEKAYSLASSKKQKHQKIVSLEKALDENFAEKRRRDAEAAERAINKPVQENTLPKDDTGYKGFGREKFRNKRNIPRVEDVHSSDKYDISIVESVSPSSFYSMIYSNNIELDIKWVEVKRNSEWSDRKSSALDAFEGDEGLYYAWQCD